MDPRTELIPRHPAKFNPSVLAVIDGLLDTSGDTPLVLDPFAGVGGIYALDGSGWANLDIVGTELEWEWARADRRTAVADARALPFADDTFDAIVTSPCYGNRMADHHNARDISKRNTYRHALGRELSTGSAGAMQWGEEYRDLHLSAWDEAIRVLRSGGQFVLNVKNHVRKGKLVRVFEWHLRVLTEAGMSLEAVEKVPVGGLREGENHEARVDHEMVAVFRK